MSAYADLVRADGAMCHLPLDGTPTRLDDTTGNAHNATAAAGESAGATGPIAGEGCSHFDGTGWLDCALPEGFPTRGAFSYECWIKPGIDGWGMVWELFPPVVGGVLSLNLVLEASAFARAGYGELSITNGFGAYAATAGITDGAWHHVVWVTDGTIGLIYLDGRPLPLDQSWGTRPLDQSGTFTPAGVRLGATYQGTSNWIGELAHAAAYPLALTPCRVLSHYDLATTGTYTPCPDWLRLKHSSGRGYIQQNGEQVQVVAGGVGVLDLPLPTLAAPPATYVGIDPATHLPAAVPLPPPPINVAIPPTPPIPPPVAANQDVQMRCGTAQALTAHLLSLYQQWADELKPAVTVLGEVALVAFLAAFIDPMYDVAIAGAAAAGVYTVIRSLLLDLAGAAGGSTFLTPTSDAQTAIRKACFCQLTVSGGVVQVTQAAIAAWRAALPPNLGEPGTLTQQLLDALLAYTPLQDWQQAAQGAVASAACDAWTCP